MSLKGTDKLLYKTLEIAMQRMKDKGYVIKSNVRLVVDPKLEIMGYARKEGSSHVIVVSEWATSSEMFTGLLLHELSHIYFTEINAPSHREDTLREILEELRRKEGLSNREVQCLIDGYNHLQNILVDDLVFSVMDEKEKEMARRFFEEWISEHPTGNMVIDSTLLTRNAFAIASLKRRKIVERNGNMTRRNERFLSSLGYSVKDDFEWIERFLESANSNWDESEFKNALITYFERLLALIRGQRQLADLR